MSSCESCGDAADPGNHCELEYPDGDDGTQLIAVRLCDDCAERLADHWILDFAITPDPEVITGR